VTALPVQVSWSWLLKCNNYLFLCYIVFQTMCCLCDLRATAAAAAAAATSTAE